MKCHSSEESQFRHCSSGSLRRWMDRPSDGCGRTCCRGYQRSLASEHLLLIGRMLMSHFFRWSSDVIAVKDAVGKIRSGRFLLYFFLEFIGWRRKAFGYRQTIDAYRWRISLTGGQKWKVFVFDLNFLEQFIFHGNRYRQAADGLSPKWVETQMLLHECDGFVTTAWSVRRPARGQW